MNAATHDSEWQQSVFAGLLALTREGTATWQIDKRLHGAMRLDHEGVTFWLFRNRLMLDDDLELRCQTPEARELLQLVRAQHNEQVRAWQEATIKRAHDRKERIDSALKRIVQVGEQELSSP